MDTTHSTRNSIEYVDSEEPNWPPLPINPTVATLIPNHECHSIKWTINQIPTPIGEGDFFWFYFDYDRQELQSMPLMMLGKLSAIHYFIRSYAIVDFTSILHYNWNEDWIEEAEDTFWINI